MIELESKCHECARPFLKLRCIPGPGEKSREPGPGDPVLCGHCGAIGYLEENGHTVKPTESDIKFWRTSRPDSWRMACEIQAEIRNR